MQADTCLLVGMFDVGPGQDRSVLHAQFGESSNLVSMCLYALVPCNAVILDVQDATHNGCCAYTQSQPT